MSDHAPVLGFDFGQRRIGVAVGNRLTATARPLGFLAGGDHPDWAAIADLIREWQPGRLIVGRPARLNGERSELTDAAERFARRLHARFALPVDRADERLSSREAEARLRAARQQGRRRSVAKGESDAVAAQIILETWLERSPACA